MTPDIDWLRRKIQALESAKGQDGRGLVLRWREVAGRLPGGALAGAALHSVSGPMPATRHRFLLTLLRKTPGPIVWCCAGQARFHALGLIHSGVAPERLLVVEAADQAAALRAAEEALRVSTLAAVVVEVRAVERIRSRRLQLAAESGGGLGFLVHDRDGVLDEAGMIASQWRVLPLPLALPLAPPSSAGSRGGGQRLPPRRWRLELLRARGGRPGAWDVEVCDATGDLRFSSALGGGAAQSERRTA